MMILNFNNGHIRECHYKKNILKLNKLAAYIAYYVVFFNPFLGFACKGWCIVDCGKD